MRIISLADAGWIDIVYTHMDLNVEVSAAGLFDLSYTELFVDPRDGFLPSLAQALRPDF